MGGRNQADRLRRRKPRTLSTTGMHAPSQAPNHGVVMNPWRVMWCTSGTRPFSQSHREDRFPVKLKFLCPKGAGAEMSCFVTWYGLTCVVGSSPFVPLGPVVPSWAPAGPCVRWWTALPNPLRKVSVDSPERRGAWERPFIAVRRRRPRLFVFLFFFSFHPLEITQPCMYNILPLPLRRSFIDIIAEAFGHWQSVAGLLGRKRKLVIF